MVTNENDDVDAARNEISQTMVDEIVTGIRDYCSARPNPLLSPERHFFREVGCGLHAMKYDDPADVVRRRDHPNCMENPMTPQEHYARAEALLIEGSKVVEKIRDDADRREIIGEEWDSLTRRMDEHGKQAMGIWAQAQVHATLATVIEHV